MTQTIKDYFTRPHRQVYYPFDLGPNVLLINGKKCVRDDFRILTMDPKEELIIWIHCEYAGKLSVSFFYSQE